VKKFYKVVAVRQRDGAFSVCLDERPVRTPAKNLLLLPNAALAEAIADEWRTDADEIDPTAMILTRMANSALDRVSQRRDTVIGEIAGFAETDLVCYRAAHPEALREQQERHWEPLLVWLRQSKDIDLTSTESILPLDQAPDNLDALRNVVASFDDFGLSALHTITSACGSVVLGLSTAYGRIDGITAWELSLIEETYQICEWGEDPEATKRREKLRTDITAAAKFLDLVRAVA